MSGHSKWATTKHRKAAQDAKRSALFSKLSRNITVAAKEGGDPNPDINASLAAAIEADEADVYIVNFANPDMVGHTGIVEAARAAVHVPSGAIAGLDGIRAMREMGLDAVTLTTVKHPRSLGQMPPLSELIPPTAEEALIMSPEARLLFSGTAEEAIRRFPANVHVAVSLGLAGLGFSRTRVRLFADPCAAGTLHHISARAGDCTLETMTRPAPLPQNPRSSALAMYSVPALLRGLAANPKLAG